MVARLAHTQEVNGSNPFPATSPPELPERDPARDSVVGVKISQIKGVTFRSFFCIFRVSETSKGREALDFHRIVAQLVERYVRT